ncbi:hypothetical protein WUBG_15131 [Wuchereria bancrofti]|uniref:Uncharacterized protein n=1 Tax=Wuchereria bancrofti TaxID=6293 RepID=J9EEV7_WUCBA|nr:hypothetical protein WUBG_15131 [Wuchereria bancrofti]
MTDDNLTFPSKISVAPTHHLSGITLNSQAPSHSVVPPPFSDITFHAAFLRSQYEKAAALHALAANQRSALVSSAQTVDNTVLRQALTNIIGNGAMPQSTQTRPVTAIAPTPRTSTTGILPNSFMPTSVMRQMTKNNSTSMTIEEKLRLSNIPICSTQYNTIKQNIVPDHFNVPHKLAGDAVVNNMASKNAANLMTRLAVQQQYAQVLAAMQNGLSLNNWQSNAQMTASMRAQALAAHAEHQRQYALAMMRGDVNQAQVIRARFLSQQAAAFATLPNVPVAPHPHHAHLMNKLNKFARLQNGTTDDVSCMTDDNLTFPSKISVAPTHHLSGITLNSQAPSHSVVPPPFSDITFHAAFLRSQYEKAAALHALAANQRSALVSVHKQSIILF